MAGAPGRTLAAPKRRPRRTALRKPWLIAAVSLAALATVVAIMVALMLLFVRGVSSAANACAPGSNPAAATQVAIQGGPDQPGPGVPPRNFIPAYFAAVTQPDAQIGLELGPYVLMAIHEIESGFGRSNRDGVKSGINFADCCKGPFQFYDTAKWSTWNAKSRYSGKPFGRDGDGDGDVDIYSNLDGMFAAAAYLRHSGAPLDWNAAILSYNKSVEYRDKVLDRADFYAKNVTPPEGIPEPEQEPERPSEVIVQIAGAGAECHTARSTAQVTDAADGGPYQEPLPAGSYTVTAPFWQWRDTYNHAGTDLGAAAGTPIHAVGAGRVSQAGEASGYGLYTCIDHTQRLRSCYAHQSRIDVRVGDGVRRGDKIGEVGTTGHSTGNHLHFEIRLDGVVRCPANYVGADPAMWCASGSPGFGAQVGRR